MNKIKLPIFVFIGLSVVLLVFLLIFEKRDSFKIFPDQNKMGIEVFQKDKIEHTQLNWIGRWENEGKITEFEKSIAINAEFLNQKVAVNLKYLSEIGNQSTSILITEEITKMLLTSSNKWDIIWFDEVIYNEVGKKLNDKNWGEKFLVNFENIPGFKESHKDFIFKNKDKTANCLNGNIFGPYIEGNYYVIWYNSEITKKIGIKIKETGMTLSDLLDYVEVIQSYNKKYNTYYAPLYESSDKFSLELLFQNLYLSEIGGEINKSNGINVAALRKTLEAFEQLGKYSPLIKSHLKNNWFNTRSLVLNNKAVFYIAGLEMYNHWNIIDEAKAIKMKPAELPVFKNGDYLLGHFYPTWAIIKDSPNKELAINLMLQLSNKEIAKKWNNISLCPTGLEEGVINDFIVKSDPAFREIMEKKYNFNVHYYPLASYLNGKMDKVLLKNLNDNLRNILTGKITANDALNNLMQNLNN